MERSMRRIVILAAVLIGLLAAPQVEAEAQPLAQGKVVMWSVGTDDHQTRLFQIRGNEWQIAWSYNCHPSGSKSDFSIEVQNRAGELQDLAVNEIGWGRHATEYLHQGGVFYLDVSSGCSWNLKIYGSRSSRLLPISGRAVVLDVSGSGNQQTRLFRIPSEWQLRWRYDCHASGYKGAFSVELKRRSGELDHLAVNEIHWSDYGTEYMHQAGTFYMAVSSSCTWHAQVRR